MGNLPISYGFMGKRYNVFHIINNDNKKIIIMKTIIETDETNLAAVQFKKNNKVTDWEDLSQAEQIKVLNAFSAYYGLYSKFIKPE